MNKYLYSIVATLLLVPSIFAQRSIVVKNTTKLDRKSEMVEVRTCNLKANFATASYVLKNDKGQEVAFQLLKGDNKNRTLIFQADVAAGSFSVYTLSKGQPSKVKAKTSARFIPERKDDFAWENDLAAYRMYGPALANEKPSNGVDIWLKNTEKLVVDQRYNDELKNNLTYHVDRGNGMDCYKVGHTLGCGGIAPFSGDSLWIGNHFDTYKVIENGPLRSVFMLTYDSVKVGNDYYKQLITITTDAGSMLNKAVVKYEGSKKNMELAAGIYLHDEPGNLFTDKKNGIIGYAENAITNANIFSGRSYVGVYVPSKVDYILKKSEHSLLLSMYKVGRDFTYYFGGGWSKWKYNTDADWFEAMNHFAETKKQPLKISFK